MSADYKVSWMHEGERREVFGNYQACSEVFYHLDLLRSEIGKNSLVTMTPNDHTVVAAEDKNLRLDVLMCFSCGLPITGRGRKTERGDHICNECNSYFAEHKD